MQYWMSAVDYPLNIGGKPPHSWPAFIVITFEMTILFAGISAVLGMLALNGLPMPYHPVFNVPRFSSASKDRFFLIVFSSDKKYDPADTRRFLEALPRAPSRRCPAKCGTSAECKKECGCPLLCAVCADGGKSKSLGADGAFWRCGILDRPDLRLPPRHARPAPREPALPQRLFRRPALRASARSKARSPAASSTKTPISIPARSATIPATSCLSPSPKKSSSAAASASTFSARPATRASATATASFPPADSPASRRPFTSRACKKRPSDISSTSSPTASASCPTTPRRFPRRIAGTSWPTFAPCN